MDFILSGQKDFDNLWNRFITENTNVSWRYLSKWIEFQRIYAGSSFVKDLSFIILNDNIPVSICPLFMEQNKGIRQFTYVDSYQAAPLITNTLGSKYKEKIQRACLKKIDELAKDHCISKIMFILDPLAEKYDYNLLSEYGYLDSSISTCIIILSLNEKQLWSDLRKSFKSLINNGKKKFRIFIMDYSNPDYDIHEMYRKLHHKAAGRLTRPLKTFDLQFEMLKEDNAILIGLEANSRFIGFSYFFHFNKKVYYGSSSDDPDYVSSVPLEHCILWTAIEYYKKRGFELLETGSQNFGHQIFDQPTKKDMDISFFKRGFGGKIVSLYRGIRYYDKEYMNKELTKRLIYLNNCL